MGSQLCKSDEERRKESENEILKEDHPKCQTNKEEEFDSPKDRLSSVLSNEANSALDTDKPSGRKLETHSMSYQTDQKQHKSCALSSIVGKLADCEDQTQNKAKKGFVLKTFSANQMDLENESKPHLQLNNETPSNRGTFDDINSLDSPIKRTLEYQSPDPKEKRTFTLMTNSDLSLQTTRQTFSFDSSEFDLATAFQNIDRDRDGLISKPDIMRELKRTNPGADESKMNQFSNILHLLMPEYQKKAKFVCKEGEDVENLSEVWNFSSFMCFMKDASRLQTYMDSKKTETQNPGGSSVASPAAAV